MTTRRWDSLADRVLAGGAISRAEALMVLHAPDEELLDLLAAAYRIRRRHFGNQVQIHILSNAKSGLCSENCSFCSQSAYAHSGIDTYPQTGRESLVEQARRARAAGGRMFCMVTATRGADELDLDDLCAAVREIRRDVGIKVCASLGLLTAESARRLAEAGVNRFNHNLESSERFFPEICTTHTWQERRETIRLAREAGMETCSGGIVGLGEGDDDVVEMAFTAREIGAVSIPVNFLNARPGTPLEGRPALSPARCLKILCLFRFVNPDREIRASAGREICLGALEPLCLYPANSLFADGYLTTPGRPSPAVLKMIADLGMEAVPE